MSRFLKKPWFWLLVLVPAGVALSLTLTLHIGRSVTETRLRNVRIGMTETEVIAALGQPNGDRSRALLWRDDSLLRKRKDRLWVHFNPGVVNEVHIQHGESDKRSLIERIRDLWQGSQDGYESYERSPEF
jgi:hypothetical protein